MRKSNKLSIFLIIIIILSSSLIVFKVFNKSYALPEVPPTIDTIEKTSDIPPEITINYTLNDMTENYKAKIVNETTSKEYVIENDSVGSFSTNENLEKGKEYTFYIKVCDIDDETSCIKSDKKTIMLEKDPAPTNVLGKISNLQVSDLKSTSVKVKWNAATGATTYKLKYKRSNENNYYDKNTHTMKTTSVTIKSLKPNTKYDVMVTGLNEKNSGENNWVKKSFITSPDTPNISKFKAEAETSKSIKLSWKKVNNKKIHYRIYRSTDGKRYTKVKTLGYKTTSYVNKKLKANRTYYYKMRTIDKTTRKGSTFVGNYTTVKKVKTPLKDKKTYILVSIKKQKLWFYKKGKLILKSKVVTGTKNKTATPKGTYKIRGKARSAYLVGDDYVSFVNYWMLIDGGLQIGLHDATWRSTFGGTIYKRNGSHGCVNLPYNVAKKIYKKAPIGTKVIIK